MANNYFTKITPTDKTDLDILYYEVETLNDQANYVTQNQIEMNAFLEAFLIHTRNLIYFLSDEGYPEDLKISDFKDKGNKKLNKIIIDTNLIGKNSNKINLYYIHKHVVHLSKKRKEKKFSWSMDNIRNEINRCLKFFIEYINEEYFLESKNKKENFEKLIKL